eukprot:221005-Pleurochrysis_carterae.AAC.1
MSGQMCHADAHKRRVRPFAYRRQSAATLRKPPSYPAWKLLSPVLSLPQAESAPPRPLPRSGHTCPSDAAILHPPKSTFQPQGSFDAGSDATWHLMLSGVSRGGPDSPASLGAASSVPAGGGLIPRRPSRAARTCAPQRPIGRLARDRLGRACDEEDILCRLKVVFCHHADDHADVQRRLIRPRPAPRRLHAQPVDGSPSKATPLSRDNAPPPATQALRAN